MPYPNMVRCHSEKNLHCWQQRLRLIYSYIAAMHRESDISRLQKKFAFPTLTTIDLSNILLRSFSPFGRNMEDKARCRLFGRHRPRDAQCLSLDGLNQMDDGKKATTILAARRGRAA